MMSMAVIGMVMASSCKKDNSVKPLTQAEVQAEFGGNDYFNDDFEDTISVGNGTSLVHPYVIIGGVK